MIHGIRDEAVKSAPTFREIAKNLVQFLEGSDRLTRDIEKRLMISHMIRGIVLPFNVSFPLKVYRF